MRNLRNTDERGEPSIDALDAHARKLLFETLGNDRRPIAVVGSGLSVVYGGITWDESVTRAIRYTLERISDVFEALAKPPERTDAAAIRVFLGRQRAALKAFDEKDATKKSSEKYVALDLCSQALDRIDQIVPIAGLKKCPITDKRKENVSSFRHFMANMYMDDTYMIGRLIVDRHFPEKEKRDPDPRPDIETALADLDPQQMQRLASIVYSLPYLKSVVEKRPTRADGTKVDDLLTTIIADLTEGTEKIGVQLGQALPIDRRSLLCLFVGGLSVDQRKALLDEAILLARSDGAVEPPPPYPILDPIGRIQQSLRVKRYVTLNFDYVIEQRVLLDDYQVTKPRPYRLDDAERDGLLERDGETGGLTRRFADGLVASTDVYDAKAVGRVFEFALDSSEFRAQVLHLHGRADKPRTMLLTDSDSNAQYRRDRATRTSLEQALDVILTGNPVVFVGIGLSEAEITRALRELVSRGHPTAYTPVFAIMAADNLGTTAWRSQLALFQQYGIHTIHAGLAGKGWIGLGRSLAAIKVLAAALDAPVDGTGKDPFADTSAAGVIALDSPDLMPVEMCGDRAALREIRDVLRSERRKTLADAEREGWKDYLGKLQSKLYTLAMERALRDIDWGWRDYAAQRRLPIGQDRFGALAFGPSPQDEDASDQSDAALYQFRVREAGLFDQADDVPPSDEVPSDGTPETEPTDASQREFPKQFWRHQPRMLPSDFAEGGAATGDAGNGAGSGATPPPTSAEAPGGVDGAAQKVSARDHALAESRRLAKKIDDHLETLAAQIIEAPKPLATCFAPLGCGKGRLLGHIWNKRGDRPILVVNCNFGIEFDSVLSQILAFLMTHALKSEGDNLKKEFGDPMHRRIHALRKIMRVDEPRPEPETGGPPKTNEASDPTRPVIVISGIERLIDRRGKPVSPEFDLLMNVLLHPNALSNGPCRIVILGASGCRDYVERILLEHERNSANHIAVEKREDFVLARIDTYRERAPWEVEWQHPKAFGFLGHLIRTALEAIADNAPRNADRLERELFFAASRSPEATVPNSARSHAIEAVMRVVLEHWHEIAFPNVPAEAKVNRLRAQLDQYVLAKLAFVGMPIEESALDHQNTPAGMIEQIAQAKFARDAKDPNVSFGGVTRDDYKSEGRDTIERLKKFGFAITIEPHDAIRTGQASRTDESLSTDASTVPELSRDRVVLHRSVMAEMRERIGVRSGDELLSNSFSATLAISMPTDLVVAEEETTNLLKEVVGRFRGSWRDPILDETGLQKDIQQRISAVRRQIQTEALALDAASGGAVIDGDRTPDSFDAEAIKAEAWLRNLDRALRMAATDMQVNIRAAAGVIRGFFSAASLVAQMPTKPERGDRELGEFEEHKRRIDRTMARFREAQRATASADRYLRNIEVRFPKVGDGQAFKELSDLADQIKKWAVAHPKLPALYGAELVWLLNESGVIALLQGDLYSAQRSLRDAHSANLILRNRMPGQVSRRIEINRSLLRIERGRIVDARTQLEAVERELITDRATRSEQALIQPLIESYYGLCDHLGGSYLTAKKHFDNAITAMQDTDQQRALAVTYVRRAALNHRLGDSKAAAEDVDMGTALAEAGRQMDILWRAQLTGVHGLGRDREAMTIFREAKRYAHVMQIPRIEIHALRSEAEFYLDQIDDYEYAGSLAAEAMTLATRYGMVLQRIALRVLMGRILIRRNDPSGRHLLERAISHADRVGYQLQVDHAQRAFLKASQQQPM